PTKSTNSSGSTSNGSCRSRWHASSGGWCPAPRSEAVMALPTQDAPSVALFRQRLRSMIEREAAVGTNRDVVVVAVDGVPYDIGCAAWPDAVIERLASEFPTTSTTSWLSSLTGTSVDAHGVAGVVFKVPGSRGRLINALAYRGRRITPRVGSIFTDAARYGYTPLCVCGDLSDYDCAWRRALLEGARCIFSGQFCAGQAPYRLPSPGALAQRVRSAILNVLDRPEEHRPRLVWCFIDLDSYIHRNGYDDYVVAFLRALNREAARLANDGRLVVGHSDHGLVQTTHSAPVERLLDHVCRQSASAMGGAGRVRWIYVDSRREATVERDLRRALHDVVDVRRADEFFAPTSLARKRVG